MLRLLLTCAVVLVSAIAAQTPPVAPSPVAPSEAPPAAAAQDRMLDAMEKYGARYVASLPNFLCVQVTHQFEARYSSNRWHKGDTLTSRLSFRDGEEKRTLDLVNGKPADPSKRHWHAPLTTEGEFGTLLSRIVDPYTDASFTWDRWETVRGKRLAVFNYTVDKDHSTLKMQLSDVAQAVLPYHGSMFVDPDTGAVWRITDAADSDIPPQLQMRQISTVIDYAETQIGGKTYLLPATASVAVVSFAGNVRNDLEFQDYRKFEADSVIKFGDATGEQH
jgi:hypothetical protein